MARPRIGIFGALVAVGGVIAWRWAQRHRSAQARLNRDLNRWEGEGGSVDTAPQMAPATSGVPRASTASTHRAGQGNGKGDAWPFPHGEVTTGH